MAVLADGKPHAVSSMLHFLLLWLFKMLIVGFCLGCSTSADETTFWNFKLLRQNGVSKSELDRDTMEFWFSENMVDMGFRSCIGLWMKARL